MLKWLYALVVNFVQMCSRHSETDGVRADAERPEEWNVLYQNEKELARVNYEKEEERYKLLTDKAKVTFVVATLIGSLGLSKLDTLIPAFAGSCVLTKRLGYCCLAALVFTLSAAVVLALIALCARKCKAVSRCQDYVELLYDKDQDTMQRSVADIYQSTADENAKTNEALAKLVNSAMICVTASFLAAMLFVGTYGYAMWFSKCGLTTPIDKGTTTLTTEKSKTSNSNVQKQQKPPEPVKVQPRIVTAGNKKSPTGIPKDARSKSNE